MSASFSSYRQVTLPSGEATCVELGVPHRGVLSRIMLKQSSGSLEGFSVDIYDQQNACPPNTPTEEKDAVTGLDVTLDPYVHKITPTLSAAALASEASLLGGGLAYENKDEPSGNKVPTNRIYLSVTPAGTGDKDFDIGVSVVSNIL